MAIVLENEQIRVVVNEFGAELASIIEKKSKIEFLWQADKTYWGRHAPVLFPIVGRLHDDQYTYNGQTYHMGQHGFARDNEFQVVAKSSERTTLRFESSAETLKAYPFAFVLELSYELIANSVKVSYHVENPAGEELIFGIGGHPAFNVPFEAGVDEFTDYAFTFDPESTRTQLPLVGPFIDYAGQKAFETRGKLAITHELFKNDALVFETPGVNAFSIVSNKNPHAVRLEMDNLPFVGLWSPYPKESSFVCIEPWCSHADTVDATGDLTDKKAMIKLASQTDFNASYTISVE